MTTPFLDPRRWLRRNEAEVRRNAAKVLTGLPRRAFLARGLSLGSLALMTGCSFDSEESIERALRRVSAWNDRVQAWMFSPACLAPTFPESEIARPFPFNAFYPEAEAPAVEAAGFQLEVGGLVAEKTPWTLAALGKLPQESQVTRHICIEGWSAIGKWTGVRFSRFLARIGADTRARYVAFDCADGYRASIDMPTALHPQTLLTLGFDGATLPRRHGFPMKLRVPTKLGFKNPKHITALRVTNEFTGGFWEDYGYNWFSGL